MAFSSILIKIKAGEYGLINGTGGFKRNINIFKKSTGLVVLNKWHRSGLRTLQGELCHSNLWLNIRDLLKYFSTGHETNINVASPNISHSFCHNLLVRTSAPSSLPA